MNYTDAIKYLEKATVLGSKRGHENLAGLLDLLGNPHKNLKYIHIAGTNGKGSVSSMLYSILLEQGYNTGLFTSPHLSKYNERFAFNNELISDEEFAYYVNKIKCAVEAYLKNSNEYFCFFEIMTAMAFCFFCDKKADYVVLETGLGGRMDNTNIIENPVLTVITSVSLDHTAFLGDTVEKIAWEKAGIIKENCPVVLYPQKKSVYEVIKQVADGKNAPMYYVEDYNYKIIENNFDKTVFSTCTPLITYDKIELRLIGNYQVMNGCNALVAVKALRDRNVVIDEKSVYAGMKKASINGRMEIISRNPLTVIDGAHNEGGINQICNFINQIKNDYNVTVLFGVLNDKNFNEMLNSLYCAADSIILSQPCNKRAMDCEKLSELLSNKDKLVSVEKDLNKALDTALNYVKNLKTDKKNILICCGSIYFIGDIRRSFNV